MQMLEGRPVPKVLVLISMVFIMGCGYMRHIRFAERTKIFAVNVSLAQNQYSAGVYKDILKPPDQSWLAGFNRGRKAYGIHDNPEVRALAISDGHKIYVWLTADTIGLQRGEVEKIRKAVKVVGAEAQIDEFSSHTHSAPDVIGIWGNGIGPGGKIPLTSGRDEDYIDYVVEKSAQVVVRAIETIRPVSIQVFSTQSNLSKNRREPEILDKKVSILAFVADHERKMLALVVNFGCHPEVLHRENHLVTADFVGPLREMLDESLQTTTLFVNGSLGGMIQPNFSWKQSGDFKSMEKMGRHLALDVMGPTPEFLGPLPHQPISYKKETVRIPLENRLFWWASFLGFMPSRGAVWSGVVETEVSVLRLQNVTIVMIPGEIVPELGLRIKELGGPGTQVWSLANDEIGYILVPEKFHTKTFRYERTMSVGPKAGEVIMKAVEKLLKETAPR